MATLRKDRHGYSLRVGECQRVDGRYSFSYTDREHNRHSVYAKTLVELRTKERKILRELDDGLNPAAIKRATLNQAFDKYISQKYDLKPSTRENYKYMYDRFVRNGFGRRKIAEIRYTDIKKYYYDVLLNKLAGATLDNIHSLLHPTFRMAIRDGLILTNPTEGVMAEIKRSHLWNKEPRRSLTVPQQQAFVNFIQTDRRYKAWEPILTVLLGTGMRISECLGLRWEDLDFEKRIITVDHGLVYVAGDEDRGRHISKPKTRAGIRTIPMIEEVFNAFLREYEVQKCLDCRSITIDGYTNFVFRTSTGGVLAATSVNRAIREIIRDYNELETRQARKEKRDPLLLPKFSAHSLRHTFCTRFCENESNLKVIQSIMGHADITTTMDIYAEATQEKKQEIMYNLQGKII